MINQDVKAANETGGGLSPRSAALLETALIFLVFFVFAAWPVPDVNETHYLTKAKHYWDPDWCRGDFFLESTDAHLAFYWSFGWVTRLVPLAAAAWIGRLLTWGLLAWAWRRASVSLVDRPLFAVLSAALFVAGTGRYDLSGEWVVGGVEAKGFAYVFVLLAVEAVVRNRWNRAWILLGAASAFHVLVGGWAAIAAGFAWLVAGRERTSLRQMGIGLAAGLLLSLFGLVPVLMLNRDAAPQVVAEANSIYVYERLAHHLAPHMAPAGEWLERLARSSLLLVTFLVLAKVGPDEGRVRRLRGFVVGAILIACGGLVICYAAKEPSLFAAGLLRFYWFRLYDMALALGVALMAVVVLAGLLSTRPRLGGWGLAIALALATWHLGLVVYARHRDLRPRAEYKLASAVEWREMCQWIAANTPADARFLTPRRSQSFHWRAGRAEVVVQKNIPQNAQAIVEWRRRMRRVHGDDSAWGRRYCESLAARGGPPLVRLGREFGADYVVTATIPRLPLELLHANATYAVYRLAKPGSGPYDEEER